MEGQETANGNDPVKGKTVVVEEGRRTEAMLGCLPLGAGKQGEACLGAICGAGNCCEHLRC